MPVKWGFLAFPGVDILDVYGPIEMLYLVAANRHLSVKIITPSDANIVVSPPMGNRYNSTYSPEVVGAATMDEDLDLDILVVPGGAAARDPDLGYVDDYVAAKMPSLRYLHTICTGAIFAARAGVLDGRRATTNKNAWDLVTAHGNNVTWVAPARYVIDGNVWSSSGVSLLPPTSTSLSHTLQPWLIVHFLLCPGHLWHGHDCRVCQAVLRRGYL